MDIGFLRLILKKYRQKYRHFSKCRQSVLRQVVDPAHFDQLSVQCLGKSDECPAHFGVANSAQAQHENAQSAETADCVAIILRTLANRYHARAGNLGNYVAAQGFRVCCALLRRAVLRAKISAAFVACRTPGFRAYRAAYPPQRFPASDYLSV